MALADSDASAGKRLARQARQVLLCASLVFVVGVLGMTALFVVGMGADLQVLHADSLLRGVVYPAGLSALLFAAGHFAWLRLGRRWARILLVLVYAPIAAFVWYRFVGLYLFSVFLLELVRRISGNS